MECTGQVRTQVKELRSLGSTRVVSEKKEKRSFTRFLPPRGFFSSIKEDEDTSDSVIVSLFYHILAA